MSTTLQADRVITGEADLAEAWVTIDDGVIVAVGQGTPPEGEVTRVDGWLIPGFVDMHVHGGGGGSFSAAEVPTITQFHRSHGTTCMLASLVSEPLDVLEDQVRALLPYVETDVIAGIHLEGPFLASRRCGAHDPGILADPAPEIVQRLIALAGSALRMVTLAPEREHAFTAIKTMAEAGVIVALGHTDADAPLSQMAVDAGATQVTHLFNGMRPLHHRDTGLSEVGLLDPRLVCELILDTHHLSDGITEIALRMLGDRWIAITDAMAAAGVPDGRFMLGALPVQAKDGIVRVEATGSLAGSTLTMDRAFDNIVNRFHRTPLEAVQATATRPAALMRRPDVGAIVPGRRADILVWRDRDLARVMQAGRWIS